eukprot:XP_001611106.1 hypothetical protein [Babesia bovis T2Bo]
MVDGCPADSVMEAPVQFREDSTPEKLLELTATYWRRLRYKRPVLLTCNVDTSIECRMADTVLAAGATCHSISDIPSLLHRMTQYGSSNILGCYIRVSSNDSWLDAHHDLYDSLSKGCNALVVDVTVEPGASLRSITGIDSLLSGVKPTIIRFITGTTTYLGALVPGAVLPNAELTPLMHAYALSKRYNAVVVDSALCPVVLNAADSEGVVFPRPPSVAKKVHGFDASAGAIVAAMAACSSNSAMLSAITATLGVDYGVTRCADISEGPGSLAVNFIDKMHLISSSPDNLLQHYTGVKFYRRCFDDPKVAGDPDEHDSSTG